MSQSRDPQSTGSFIVPVVREDVRVETLSEVTGQVRLTKKVQETPRLLSGSVFEEELLIERREINREVAATEPTPSIRDEGGVMVIPILREEVVLVKRLVLVEEVLVRRLRHERHYEQEVVVREESIQAERVPVPDPIPHTDQ